MAPRLLTETPDMVRFITALSAFMVATAAFAQTTPVTTVTQPLIIRSPSDNLKDTFTFGPDTCAQTLTLNWTYTPSFGVVCSDITFWATDASSCGDAPVGADVPYTSASYATVLSARTGPIYVKVAELPGFVSTTLADGGVTSATTCGAADTYKVHRICGAATAGSLGSCQVFGGATTTKLHASDLKLVYDTQPPSAPVITGSTATNATATIAFTVNADALHVQAITTASTDGGDAASVTHPVEIASTGSAKVTELQNNTTYTVQLRFIDAAGNVGPLSDPITVTPILTYGFWGAYRAAGGTDQGGCSISWGLMPMLAALWFMMRRASR